MKLSSTTIAQLLLIFESGEPAVNMAFITYLFCCDVHVGALYAIQSDAPLGVATAYDLLQVSLRSSLILGQRGSDWDQASQQSSMIVGLIAEIWTTPAVIYSKQAVAWPNQVDCHRHALLGTSRCEPCKPNICT